MEKETRQRKPYQRVQCKLITYGRDSVMFAVSWSDKNDLTPIGHKLYDSAMRALNNGLANGFTYVSVGSRQWGSVEDPLPPASDCSTIKTYISVLADSPEEVQSNAQWLLSNMTLSEFAAGLRAPVRTPYGYQLGSLPLLEPWTDYPSYACLGNGRYYC